MTAPDFTIADVLAFARTKPADERYYYCNSGRCALAQFGLATNREHLVGPRGTSLLYKWRELKEALAGGEETFGALVARLEKLCPVPPSEWTRLDAYMNDIEQVA